MLVKCFITYLNNNYLHKSVKSLLYLLLFHKQIILPKLFNHFPFHIPFTDRAKIPGFFTFKTAVFAGVRGLGV